MARHERVLLSVYDAERRCIFGDVFDGIGTPHLLDIFLNRAPDQSRFRRGGWIVFQACARHGMGIHLQEVGRAEEIHHRLHPTRLFRVAALALEIKGAPGGAQERDQVPTGRRSPDADAFRVQVVRLCVRPQPADGRLAVLDLRGEDGVLAQPVVDGGHRVSLADQGQRHHTAVFAPAHPRAAMDPHDYGERRGGFLRDVEVKPLPRVAARYVFQVGVDLDTVGQLGPRSLGGSDRSHRDQHHQGPQASDVIHGVS